MSSLIETHKVRLKEMLKDGALFGDPVPTQRDASNPPSGATVNHGGELRGFYPGRFGKKSIQLERGRWFPKNSERHAKKKVTVPAHRAHSGVDIYAPYVPFPYEIPLLALADGELAYSFWTQNYNKIGSQAVLFLKDSAVFGARYYRFIYGHLNRFRPINPVTWAKGIPSTRYVTPGARILVKQGDVIGYIGISGNANTKGEATTLQSPAGVSACHIHLMLTRNDNDGTNKVLYDPTSVLGFGVDMVALRDGSSDPDDIEAVLKSNQKPTPSQLARPPAARWKSENNNRDSYGTPKYNGTTLKMAGETKAQGIVIPAKKRVSRRRPNVPPWPFHGLNLDQHHLLNATVKAYEVVKRGLTGSVGPYTNALLDVQDGELKSVVAGQPEKRVGGVLATVTTQDMQKRVGVTLADLNARAIAAADPAKFNSADRAARVTAALLHLIEGQYALMGGPGYEGPGTGDKKYAQGLVTSGVGVQGQLVGVASVGEREATTNYTPELALGYLHLTWKAKDATSRPEYAAISAGFGSGSGREATFSAQTAINLKSKWDAAADGTPEKKAYEALYDYCVELVLAHMNVRSVIDHAISKRTRLIGSQATQQVDWERFCAKVASATRAQHAVAEIYRKPEINTDQWHQRLWLEIAVEALAVIKKTAKTAQKPTGKKESTETSPAQPEMRLLYSETPPPTEQQGGQGQ